MKTKHKEKICDLILQHSVEGEEILFFDKAITLRSALPTVLGFLLKMLFLTIPIVIGWVLIVADIDPALYPVQRLIAAIFGRILFIFGIVLILLSAYGDWVKIFCPRYLAVTHHQVWYVLKPFGKWILCNENLGSLMNASAGIKGKNAVSKRIVMICFPLQTYKASTYKITDMFSLSDHIVKPLSKFSQTLYLHENDTFGSSFNFVEYIGDRAAELLDLFEKLKSEEGYEYDVKRFAYQYFN